MRFAILTFCFLWFWPHDHDAQASDFDLTGSVGSTFDSASGFDEGIATELALGYSFNEHVRSEISWLRTSNLGGSAGDFEMNSALVTGWFTPVTGDWEPSVGYSVGKTWVDSSQTVGGTDGLIHGPAAALAYQVSESTQVVGTVRYLMTNLDMQDQETDDFDSKTATIGLRYQF